MKRRSIADQIKDLTMSLRNAHNVVIQYHPEEPGGELEVYYELPEFWNIAQTFAYGIYYSSVEAFATDFAISCFEDLDNITPDHLIASYENGSAHIYCRMGNDDYLFLKREDLLLYAEDCLDEKHLVCKRLEGPEDYLDYVRKYYADWE